MTAATSPKMVPRLSELPEELISNIACKLGADDKFALRLTCRTLEDRSFHEFATDFFSRKCVHLTTDSLKPLVQISASRLAKYVKEVDFVIALFSEQAFSCPGRNFPHWKPSTRQSEAYRFYVQDQKTLRDTGEDSKMLTEAFKSLPSLKSVLFLDCERGMKPDTDYRGGNKALRKTGTRPFNGDDSTMRTKTGEFRKHLEHLWSTVIGAMANAQGHHPLEIEELRTSCSTDLTYLNPSQFKLDTSISAQLPGVFGNITRLHLHVMTPRDVKSNKSLLAKFGSYFPRLKDLSLDFDSSPPDCGLLFRYFTTSLNLSQLTAVNIVGLSIEAQHLVKAVARMANVADLKLYCTDLITGTWPPVLKAMATLEKLDHLHLMYLREAGCKSYFLKQSDPREGPGFMNDVFADEWDDENDLDDDDEDDEDDDTDDDLPDLQPADDVDELAASMLQGTQAGAEPGPAPATTIPETFNGSQNEDDAMSEYVPAGQQGMGERGFYICLEGHDKIAKRLKTFIDEYNVGEFMGPDDFDMDAMGAMAGGMAIPLPMGVGAGAPPAPGGFGAAFMNAMGNAMGFGPPPPMPPPQNANPPPNTNGNANGNTNGNGNGNATTAQAPVPAPATTQTTAPATTAGAANDLDLDWESDEDDDGVPVLGDAVE